MNQERQKTDALSDAVEIPEGATHYSHVLRVFMEETKKGWFIFSEGKKTRCSTPKTQTLINLRIKPL